MPAPTQEEHIAHLTGGSGPGAGTLEVDEEPGQEDDGAAVSALKEIVDESGEGDGQVADGDGEGAAEEAPEGYVSQAEFDRIQRDASGRLDELVQLRQQQGSLAQNMEALRHSLLEQERSEPADEPIELPENIREHASMKYIKDRMDRMEGRLKEELDVTPEEQQQYQYRQAMTAVTNYTQGKMAAFKQTHDDFDDAYAHARSARRRFLIGVPEDQKDHILAQEETAIAARCMQMGTDPAEEIYKVATEFGYKKGQKPAPGPVDAGKVQAGVEAAGASAVGGARSGRNGQMSAKVFFSTMPKAQRIALLSNPDKFEELAKTGRISE